MALTTFTVMGLTSEQLQSIPIQPLQPDSNADGMFRLLGAPVMITNRIFEGITVSRNSATSPWPMT